MRRGIVVPGERRKAAREGIHVLAAFWIPFPSHRVAMLGRE